MFEVKRVYGTKVEDFVVVFERNAEGTVVNVSDMGSSISEFSVANVLSVVTKDVVIGSSMTYSDYKRKVWA